MPWCFVLAPMVFHGAFFWGINKNLEKLVIIAWKKKCFTNTSQMAARKKNAIFSKKIFPKSVMHHFCCLLHHPCLTVSCGKKLMDALKNHGGLSKKQPSRPREREHLLWWFRMGILVDLQMSLVSRCDQPSQDATRMTWNISRRRKNPEKNALIASWEGGIDLRYSYIYWLIYIIVLIVL